MNETKRLRVVLVGWSQYPTWEPTLQLYAKATTDPDYVQLSEPLEVEFTLSPPDEITQRRVGKLREIKAQIVEEFTEKLTTVNRTIAELETLTYEPNAASAPCEDVFQTPETLRS